MSFECFQYIMTNRHNIDRRNQDWPYILSARYQLMKEREAMEAPIVEPATLAD